jgi:hypothetical protein
LDKPSFSCWLFQDVFLLNDILFGGESTEAAPKRFCTASWLLLLLVVVVEVIPPHTTRREEEDFVSQIGAKCHSHFAAVTVTMELTKILNFSHLFTLCHLDDSTHDCLLANRKSRDISKLRTSGSARADFPTKVRCPKIDWNCSVTTIVRVAAQVLFYSCCTLLAGKSQELVLHLNIPP